MAECQTMINNKWCIMNDTMAKNGTKLMTHNDFLRTTNGIMTIHDTQEINMLNDTQ